MDGFKINKHHDFRGMEFANPKSVRTLPAESGHAMVIEVIDAKGLTHTCWFAVDDSGGIYADRIEISTEGKCQTN